MAKGELQHGRLWPEKLLLLDSSFTIFLNSRIDWTLLTLCLNLRWPNYPSKFGNLIASILLDDVIKSMNTFTLLDAWEERKIRKSKISFQMKYFSTLNCPIIKYKMIYLFQLYFSPCFFLMDIAYFIQLCLFSSLIQ